MSASIYLEALVFLALIVAFQFPGKSNFGVITLAARHHHKDVFLGAALGLMAATAVSVALGVGASLFLSPYLLWVKVAGGTVLLAFGLRELLHSLDIEAREIEAESVAALSPRDVRLLALSLCFFLEMGDNTQILVILFVASTGNPLLVYLAATAGLVFVAAVTAHGGRYLKERISPHRLGTLLGAIFMAVGGLTILFAFFPGWLPLFG